MSEVNDLTDEFDKKLELRRKYLPFGMDDTLVDIADTLEFAVLIAKTRLGEKWTGADAIEICRMALDRRDAFQKEQLRTMLDDE